MKIIILGGFLIITQSLILSGLLLFAVHSEEASQRANEIFSKETVTELKFTDEIIEKGTEIEVKEHATKMFIYALLNPWLVHDASDVYFKQYKAKKSVELDGPRPENIRLWIKDIKTGDRKYTHIITVLLPYESVTIDGTKKLKASDRIIYAVNANQLSFCHGSEGRRNCVKLLHSYHKAIND
ncbi:hypothetical protein [Bacillus sp. FJAT-27445]|uniref:hypothetical protein n=1 Tax=Bacillus sp. FJAT-27445 TaxID=1679166 RepID=UPI0007443DBB|nr:hypothetical protein [Bacillus sp. FJAT-27445]